MNFTRAEAFEKFNRWLTAWNMHDLDGVMDFVHTDIVFENWDGKIVKGKDMLRKLWMPWFIRHDDFKFIQEDIFFDEREQKMTFQWRLECFPIEKKIKSQNETMKGVDILEFKDGKTFRKITYSKNQVQIDSATINKNVAKQIHTI